MGIRGEGGGWDKVVAVGMERISKLGEEFSRDVKNTYYTYSQLGCGELGGGHR